MGVLQFVKKNWLLLGIVIVIFLAKLAPWIGRKDGPLYPEITIKYIAVSVIFLNSGLSLKSEELKSAIFHYKLHIFIQCFTFIVYPVLLFGLVQMLYLLKINAHLLQGIVVVSCMPPPVSSAVIITKAIGGNEAGAICNSALGSFLGVFITPILLLLFVGVSGPVPVVQIVTSLSLTVLLSLVIGQLLREYIKDWMHRRKPPFGEIGSFMLLMIIYTTFCDTFASDAGDISIQDLLLVIVLILAIQLCLLLFIFHFTTFAIKSFSREDTIALMFCATHKSLTLGIPILKVIYSGDPILPSISIPLLIYDPMQILLGGFLVPIAKAWLEADIVEKDKPTENGCIEHI